MGAVGFSRRRASDGVTDRTVVLLTGPVGGGKTSAAAALGEHLRAAGHPTAVVDLDTLYPMAQQHEPRYADIETWKIVYHAAAALTDTFFASGIEIVVVEGGFFTDDERDWLCGHLSSKPRIAVLALDVSWEETCRRVDADPSEDRVATRSRDVLRWHHNQFTAALNVLRERFVVIDSDHRSPAAIARDAAGAILSAR